MTPSRSGHLPINGLQPYHEVHRELRASDAVPLLLIPGAFMSTDSMEQWVDAFAPRRPVIVFDQQGTAGPRMRLGRCRTSSSATMPPRCCRPWRSSGPT